MKFSFLNGVEKAPIIKIKRRKAKYAFVDKVFNYDLTRFYKD